MSKKFETMTEDVSKKIEEKTGSLSQPNYLWMAIFFAIGCFFLMAAMTSLPFFLLSPSGFNIYFSLASSCMLTAVAFFYGPLNYMKKLYAKENLVISILYTASTIVSLCSLVIKMGYLASIGIALLQMVTLAFFMMQVVAGGDSASGQLKNMMASGKDAIQQQVVSGMVGMAMSRNTESQLPI